MRRCILVLILTLLPGSTSLAQPTGPSKAIDVPAYRKSLQEHVATGKIGEAAKLFKDTLRSCENTLEKRCVREEFLRAMARAGKALEAYRAFPGGKESFAVLADQLIASDRGAELPNLIEEHSLVFDDDPHLNVYRGQVAFEQKKYADADKHWTAAFEAVRDDYLHDQFQRRWIRARFESGKIVDALKDIQPRWTTFRVLAELCLENRQHDKMEELLKAYAGLERITLGAERYLLRAHANLDARSLLKLASDNGLRADAVYAFLTLEGKPLEAYAAAPDRQEAFWTIGTYLLSAQRFGELRKLIDAHRKAEPNDSKLDYVEGRMLLRARRLDEAIPLLKKESSGVGRLSLRAFEYLEACYLAGRGLQAFEEGGKPSANVATLARYYVRDNDAAGLEALLKAAPAPEAGKADLFQRRLWEYQAALKVLTGKPEEAIDIYIANRKEAEPPKGKTKKKPGFGKGTAPSVFGREGKLDDILFIRRMIDFDLGLQLYRVTPYKEDVFANIANHYERRRDADTLAVLIREHQAKFPTDPKLTVHTATLEILRGQPHIAEQILRAELAKGHSASADGGDVQASLSRANLNTTRNGLVRASILQGRTVEQYRAAGGDPEAFRMFASHCIGESLSAELAALVQVHRKNHPGDPNLRRIEGELAYLKGDFAAAFKAFEKATSLPDDGDAMQVGGFTYAGLSERDKALICLARLKRFDDAQRFALDFEHNSPSRNPIAMIYVHAAAGDVKQTLRLLQLFSKGDVGLRDFYRDENLGPVLRSDAMRAVRERFPEPAIGGKTVSK